MVDIVYFVPWVKGPGQVNRPFGLNTKYDHLVFVFQERGELYDAFFNSSVQALAEGHLETAAVVVQSREQLVQELAKWMPSDKRFGIVFEGTKEFSQFMGELANDTIWLSE